MFLYECSVGLSSIVYEWPHRYIHPLVVQPLSLMKKGKKKKTQSLKLFEYFLYQMSMVLTAGDGPTLETAPCPFLEHTLIHAMLNMSHSQVTISWLEIQPFSVTLDCVLL